jgi:hypothetical protein
MTTELMLSLVVTGYGGILWLTRRAGATSSRSPEPV